MNTLNALTTRSRVALRWTTDPDDLGYGNRPAPRTLADRPADFVGSPRQCLAEIARVRHGVGEGTHVRIELVHRGHSVTYRNLRAVVDETEYRAFAAAS